MGWVNPRAIGWARRQVVGSKVQKLVLLVLASYCTTANDCQVTVQTLARDCEIAERTLQRALGSLAKRQLITIRRCFRDGRNRPNTYALNLPTGEGGGLPRKGGADDIATPAADPDKGGAGATPTTRTALSNQLLLQPQRQPRSHDPVPELPAALDAGLRALALSLLARAPPGTAQDVADEWIARWRAGTLRNPPAYLAKLVRQAEAGRFHPELAGQERARRQGQRPAEPRGLAQDTSPPCAQPNERTTEEVKRIVRDMAQQLSYRP